MLIKVLKTTKASKNQIGNECFEYQEGQVYDIYEELAEVFIKQGWGILAEDKKEEITGYLTTENEIEEIIEEEIEEKSIEDKNIENKAINNLENKTKKTTTKRRK